MTNGALLMRKENKKRKLLNMKKDQRGTSMVTVLVSFVLLLLCLTCFYQVQKMSENIMMSAQDLISNNSNLIKAYYLDETENGTVSEKERLTFEGEDGSFSMTMSIQRAQKEGLNGCIYYFEEK